jgi:hypothetical protein
MIPRLQGVSVVAVAMLAVASVCLAAEPGYVPTKGGIGGQIGGSTFAFDRTFAKSDYSRGAEPRFAFAAHFRYAMSPRWRWQVSPGFTWAGYTKKTPNPFVDPAFPEDQDKRNYLALIVPVSAQIQVTHREGRWLTYAGAGPGAYRILLENQRKLVKDPVSLKVHKGVYPGLSAQVGAERFFTDLPSTSFEMAVATHVAYAIRDDQFPSGYNNALTAVEVRLGVNYYFPTGDKKKAESEPPRP